MKTSCRSFPGVRMSTTKKPRTRTAVPTRKYKMVASAPLKTGLRSTFPNSTARYMTVSFFTSMRIAFGEGSFGSARAAGAATRASGGRPGVEPGAEEYERAMAVAGGKVFDADAARGRAIGADRHDGVVVAQVLGAGVVGARRGALVAGERVGHLSGRSRAQIPGAAGVARVFVVVGRDI